MLGPQLNSVTFTDLTRLIEDSVREQKSIEYKRELPGKTDPEKRKFLAQVSSFANAAGGDLIYGIDAKDGVPMEIRGIPDFNEDDVRLALEGSIRTGISPRIPGIQLKVVQAESSLDPVLIIRIPRSWCGPHMMTYKGSSRFFTRASAGKYEMDVTEIRAAFENAPDISARIREWRDERLGRIIAGETPLPLHGDGRQVLHIVPLESLASTWRFSASELRAAAPNLHPFRFPHCEVRLSIDGVLKSQQFGTQTSYV